MVGLLHVRSFNFLLGSVPEGSTSLQREGARPPLARPPAAAADRPADRPLPQKTASGEVNMFQMVGICYDLFRMVNAFFG